jgi:hypothetical protein
MSIVRTSRARCSSDRRAPAGDGRHEVVHRRGERGRELQLGHPVDTPAGRIGGGVSPIVARRALERSVVVASSGAISG